MEENKIKFTDGIGEKTDPNLELKKLEAEMLLSSNKGGVLSALADILSFRNSSSFMLPGMSADPVGDRERKLNLSRNSKGWWAILGIIIVLSIFVFLLLTFASSGLSPTLQK